MAESKGSQREGENRWDGMARGVCSQERKVTNFKRKFMENGMVGNSPTISIENSNIG